MPGSPVPPTLLLALKALGRTDGKALLKSAVKELVARRVLGVETLEQPRRLRRSRTRIVLVDGPEPVPPQHLLSWVAGLVQGAPTELADGQVVRDLTQVAKHLSRGPLVRKVVVEIALTELVDTGLVVTRERKALGVFKRTIHERTAAGEAALEAGAASRRRRGDGGDAGGGFYALGADGDGGHDIDESFDSSLDAGFDSSFDSAFDSGFSDGGGGGGDGGGGGGDGGGGS